jgi:hypothetical protein
MTGRRRPQGVPLRLPRYRRRPRLSPEAPQPLSPQAHKQRRWPAEAWLPRARYPLHQPGCCPRRIPRLCPPARVLPLRLPRPAQRRRRGPKASRRRLVWARLAARCPPVLLPSSALPATSGYRRRPGSWPRRPPRTRQGPRRAAQSARPGPPAPRRLRPRPRLAVRRPPSPPGQHPLRWPRSPQLGRNLLRPWPEPVRPARRPPGVPRHVPIPVPPPPPARPQGPARELVLKTGGPCRP